MRLRLIAIVSLPLVSLGVIWLASMVWADHEPARPGPPAARSTEGDSDLLALKQEVVALRSQIARLDRELVAQSASGPTPAPAPAKPATPSERKQAALEQQRRAVTFLASRIGDEPRDPAWASKVQAELAGTLEAGAGSSVRAVECGTTLCRAEVSHPDKQRLQHFADTLSGTLHRSFQLFFERDGDVLATTIFIAREGQKMPDLAKELRHESASSVGD